MIAAGGSAIRGEIGTQPVRLRFLHGLNPLAKIAATIPAVIALVTVSGVTRPAAFLILAIALILVGATLSVRRTALLLLGLPAATLVLSVSFGLWGSTESLPGDSVLFAIGSYAFTSSMWLAGLTTALRLTAILALTFIAGLTMTGMEFARALVQQGRLPYRIAYAALAAIRFVPRLNTELETIRAAHRVRGVTGGRGPVAETRRRLGYAVPLLAGSIRHAERVALAMETRAFGAHRRRTERQPMLFRAPDALFIGLWWGATAVILLSQ